MGRRATLVAALGGALVLTVATTEARQAPSRQDAGNMEQKLASIMARGSTPLDLKRTPVRTSFTDREVNALFQYSELLRMPTGLVNPRITIADAGRLEGHALVDLDAVRKSKERTFLDPLSYVTGTVEVTATGTLRTSNGQGTFDLQSATLGGISIPKSLLQELVSYYSKTPDTPDGFDLDKPFVLPASIRSVELKPGTATIVQ